MMLSCMSSLLCFLYYVFRQKEQMKNKNEGKAVNQQYLFHGTDKSLIEAICEQNFDWRVCGVHGTAYGKGTVDQRLQQDTESKTIFMPQKKFVFSSNLLYCVVFAKGSVTT